MQLRRDHASLRAVSSVAEAARGRAARPSFERSSRQLAQANDQARASAPGGDRRPPFAGQQPPAAGQVGARSGARARRQGAGGGAVASHADPDARRAHHPDRPARARAARLRLRPSPGAAPMISRYARAELLALWSDQKRFDTWLEVELAACQAMEEEGA